MNRTSILLFCGLTLSGLLTAQIPGRLQVEFVFPAGAPAVYHIGVPLTRTAHFVAFTLRCNGPEAPAGFELRSSADGLTWSAWQPLEDDPHADQATDRRQFDMVFLPADTRLLELRAPELNAALRGELIYYSPVDAPARDPVPQRSAADRDACPCPLPGYIDRAGWGGPPTQQPGCTPAYTTVTHLVVHHQAGNANPPYSAVVGAIWQQHVFTNGWCDIGYNWLIAPDGAIFEGRAGGNNVVGAHFSGHNSNTMGVCFLGDYQTGQPTAAALSSLKKLLAWKCCGSTIEPTDTVLHAGSGLVLPTICGHRDGGATLCPGDNLYARLPEIRTATDSLYHDPTGCDGIWPPVNDACAAATLLNSHPACVPVPATTDGAGASGVAIPNCSGFTSGNALDVWFRFPATATEHQVRVQPLGQAPAALDPVVAVYRNGCSTPELVGCVDAPGGSGGLTVLELNGLAVGENYWVRVFDFGNTLAADGRFEICVTPGSSTGTAALPPFQAWSLFPNPTTGTVTLDMTGAPGTTGIFRLYSIGGQLLKELQVTGPITTIGLLTVPCGVYLAELQTSAGISTHKLLVQ